MMYRSLGSRFLLIALLAVTAVACDDEIPTLPTTPSEPVTETFSGSVTASGGSTHDFAVARAGTITATLKGIGSDNTLIVGFSMGTWNGTACSVVLRNDNATGDAVLTGTMTAAGNLCVTVYDVGNITAGATAPYSIEVVHP